MFLPPQCQYPLGTPHTLPTTPDPLVTALPVLIHSQWAMQGQELAAEPVSRVPTLALGFEAMFLSPQTLSHL